jgi:hypothetical protein
MRQHGVALYVKVGNNVDGKFFSFERATAWVIPTGRERR